MLDVIMIQLEQLCRSPVEKKYLRGVNLKIVRRDDQQSTKRLDLTKAFEYSWFSGKCETLKIA